MKKMIFTMAVTAAMSLTHVASTFANQSLDWIQMTRQIEYAEDGVTETYRIETDYDNDGRQTGYRQYQNGTLFGQYRDLQYNGRTVTYWIDFYSEGNISSSTKHQITYHDNNWMQQRLYIRYAADGVTEASRSENDIDNEGRITGYKFYSNGTLSTQRRDYQYNGRTVTYWNDQYSGGNISSSTKYQITYSDNNWMQGTLTIEYAEDDVTETYRSEIDYDNDGRETGYKVYQNGTLVQQRRDYQYNGRTITCWVDSYWGGNLFSSTKLERVYSTAYVTDIAQTPSAAQATIYSNPATGILQIEDKNLDVQQVSIFNLSGVEVLNTKNTTIDISYFSAGMYIVRVATGKGVVTEKVVKY